MSDLEAAFVWSFIGIPVICLAVFLLFRLITAAYYQSRMDYERKKHEQGQ